MTTTTVPTTPIQGKTYISGTAFTSSTNGTDELPAETIKNHSGCYYHPANPSIVLVPAPPGRDGPGNHIDSAPVGLRVLLLPKRAL